MACSVPTNCCCPSGSQVPSEPEQRSELTLERSLRHAMLERLLPRLQELAVRGLADLALVEHGKFEAFILLVIQGGGSAKTSGQEG